LVCRSEERVIDQGCLRTKCLGQYFSLIERITINGKDKFTTATFYNLYCLSNNVSVIKSRRARLEEYVVRMKEAGKLCKYMYREAI
jgi:hypothetical protein